MPPSNPKDRSAPPDETLVEDFPQRVRRIVAITVADLRDSRGALLEILHRIQEEFAHVPPKAVPIVADELNLTRAEVHGVVSFYQDFRDSMPGRHILRICQAESCQALGSRSLTAKAKALLNVDFNERTADGAFTLEPVYCLGNCALSPAVQIDSDICGRVTEQRLSELIQEVVDAS